MIKGNFIGQAVGIICQTCENCYYNVQGCKRVMCPPRQGPTNLYFQTSIHAICMVSFPVFNFKLVQETEHSSNGRSAFRACADRGGV